MVGKQDIKESIDKSILKKELEGIVVKSFVEVVKCSTNSATHAGEGAVIKMADDSEDGKRVPKRLLQHKGYSETGEDLGYISDIKYESGFEIDYKGGKIIFPDGTEFKQDFLDNFKQDGNGKLVHDKKGSAEELFDYQFKEASLRGGKDSERAHMLNIATDFKDGSAQNLK